MPYVTDIGLSEFAFGFAFLYEQTRLHWADLVAAPILPSLVQEHELAYDARLPLRGIDYYYQFKLSDYMKGGRAKHYSVHKEPFFQFALHHADHNRQHRRLRALAVPNRHVYYVAPEFGTYAELSNHLLAGNVSAGSRLIPLRECPDLRVDDDDRHSISFVRGNPRWSFHSDPKFSDVSYAGEAIVAMYKDSKNEWEEVDRSFALKRYESAVSAAMSHLADEGDSEIKEVLQQQIREWDGTESREHVLLELQRLLAGFFGVTMLVVGEGREGK